ncbi:MAG: hypothetical protein JNN12_12645 [Bacteroidetes Order II. Incertae sedis bacterium]|nr:hypothetical protein [Bacteroidetes Order II. bacterium]
MNNIFRILTFLFLGFFNLVNAQSLFGNWPELGLYHDVLSTTFHPSENGDTAPIKAKSGELASWAQKVAGKPIPTPYDTRPMRKTIQKLKKESVKMDRMVRKGRASEAAIIAQLSKTHDVFHEVIRLSKEPHEDHH